MIGEKYSRVKILSSMDMLNIGPANLSYAEIKVVFCLNCINTVAVGRPILGYQ